MAVVKWLGPPENSVGLIGFGRVTPGDVITLDNDFADKLIAEGRAALVDENGDVVVAEVNATDAAVVQARENNVDLTTVQGTGKDDKITKADVVAVDKETS